MVTQGRHFSGPDRKCCLADDGQVHEALGEEVSAGWLHRRPAGEGDRAEVLGHGDDDGLIWVLMSESRLRVCSPRKEGCRRGGYPPAAVRNTLITAESAAGAHRDFCQVRRARSRVALPAALRSVSPGLLSAQSLRAQRRP